MMMSQMMLKPLNELTTQDKETVYKYKQQFIDYFDAIEADLLSADDLVDFVKATSKGRRSWIKDQDLIINTLKERGLQNPTEPKLMSLGAVEKLIGTAGTEGLLTEGTVKTVLKEKPEELKGVEQPSNTGGF